MYIEPSIGAKSKEIENKFATFEGIPVFSIVEFNIWGACNRKCEFCPVSDPSIWTNRHEGITLENYRKILFDLADIEYKGVILWSTFSEPLLHKGSLDLLRSTKEILPNSPIHVVSNGDVIRKRHDFILELFKAGLDKLQLSLYDGEDQYREFEELGKNLGLSSEQWELRRRFFDGSNFGLTISNRAGLIDSNAYRALSEQSIPTQSLPLKQPCTYLFYQIVIDWDGEVLMCAHDWKRELILGNAFEDTIWSIWSSAKSNRIRNEFMKSNRDFSPCAKCDVNGTIMGEKHFEEFSKLLKK
jgi:radical SAM protein with 4Fe4S-binding SPASM domain